MGGMRHVRITIYVNSLMIHWWNKERGDLYWTPLPYTGPLSADNTLYTDVRKEDWTPLPYTGPHMKLTIHEDMTNTDIQCSKHMNSGPQGKSNNLHLVNSNPHTLCNNDTKWVGYLVFEHASRNMDLLVSGVAAVCCVACTGWGALLAASEAIASSCPALGFASTSHRFHTGIWNVK